MATREQAYELMANGCLVTHDYFKKGTYIFMNENYVIHDQDNNTFEDEWDNLDGERYKTGWRVYDNKNATDKKGNLVDNIKHIREESKLISHIPGTKCPGKKRCYQYQKVAGETACLICDCNPEQHLISETEANNNILL